MDRFQASHYFRDQRSMESKTSPFLAQYIVNTVSGSITMRVHVFKVQNMSKAILNDTCKPWLVSNALSRLTKASHYNSFRITFCTSTSLLNVQMPKAFFANQRLFWSTSSIAALQPRTTIQLSNTVLAPSSSFIVKSNRISYLTQFLCLQNISADSTQMKSLLLQRRNFQFFKTNQNVVYCTQMIIFFRVQQEFAFSQMKSFK